MGLITPQTGLYQGLRTGAPSNRSRSTYCQEAKNLFERMSTAPTNELKIRINNIILALINANFWSRFDIFYYFGVETQDQAILNWVSTNYPVTVMNSCTFVQNSGYEGDGVSMYLRSEFISSNGVQYQQNNASVGSIFYKLPTTNLRMLYGTRYATTWSTSERYYSGDFEYITLNTTTTTAAGLNRTINSLIVYNRENDSTIQGYLNGGSKKNISLTSTGRSTSKTAIHTLLYGTTTELFGQGGCKLFFMGANFTESENATLANILLNI